MSTAQKTAPKAAAKTASKVARTPAKKSAASVKSSAKAAPKAQEATALLRADHKAVSELFDQYEKTRSSAKKKVLVQKICRELTVHAQVEEELFYPPVREATGKDDLMDEANARLAAAAEIRACAMPMPEVTP